MKCAPAPGANLPAWIMPAALASATVGYFSAAVRATTMSAASAVRVALSSGLSGCDSTASPNASVGTVVLGAALFGLDWSDDAGRVVTAEDPPPLSDARPTAKAADATTTAASTASTVHRAPRRPRRGRSGVVGSGATAGRV